MKHTITKFLFILALLNFTMVYADPPSRVARINLSEGPVSFSPANSNNQWFDLSKNRPLTTGDKLWADTGGRVEIQLPAATLRMNENTNLNIVNLDDHIAQFQIPEGTVNLTIRRINPHQSFEIDTPNLAYSITRPGSYRIDVNNNTVVTVRQGQGTVYGEKLAYTMDTPQTCRFIGTNLQHQCAALAPHDAFDRWCLQRDKHYAIKPKYVSPDMVGYEDLADYGTWRNVENYGEVWTPSNVSEDWAPYREGHWVWIEPWGWTWIDDEPWGFAPFHYGRWVFVDGSWDWVPGPVDEFPVYAPALVAFVGGPGEAFNYDSSGPVVGWFPLAPSEVFIPTYAYSRAYFINVNIANAHIHHSIVNQFYENPNQQIIYRNRLAQGLTAVPIAAFTHAQAVKNSAIPAAKVNQLLTAASVKTMTHLQPNASSVVSASVSPAKVHPAAQIITRQTLTKIAPATTKPFLGTTQTAQPSRLVKPQAPIPLGKIPSQPKQATTPVAKTPSQPGQTTTPGVRQPVMQQLPQIAPKAPEHATIKITPQPPQHLTAPEHHRAPVAQQPHELKHKEQPAIHHLEAPAVQQHFPQGRPPRPAPMNQLEPKHPVIPPNQTFRPTMPEHQLFRPTRPPMPSQMKQQFEPPKNLPQSRPNMPAPQNAPHIMPGPQNQPPRPQVIPQHLKELDKPER